MAAVLFRSPAAFFARYRSLPRVLLGPMIKILAGLDSLEDPLLWGPQARAVAAYVTHHVLVLVTQLRHPSVLKEVLSLDDPRRWVAPTATAELQKLAFVVDVTHELAAVGLWPLAEKRLSQLEPEMTDLHACLQKLGGDSPDPLGCARTALELFKADPANSGALQLFNAGVSRTWHREEGVLELLEEVLGLHALSPDVTRLLQQEYAKLAAYGFMLRALPPPLVQLEKPPEPKKDDDEDEEEKPEEEPKEEEARSRPAHQSYSLPPFPPFSSKRQCLRVLPWSTGPGSRRLSRTRPAGLTGSFSSAPDVRTTTRRQHWGVLPRQSLGLVRASGV